MKKGYRIEYHKQGKVIQLTSKCCGAEIKIKHEDCLDLINNTMLVPIKICSNCHKPTEVEGKEEASHDKNT